jgi:hypothetical protein
LFWAIKNAPLTKIRPQTKKSGVYLIIAISLKLKAMKLVNPSISEQSIRNGLLTALALVAYFMLMNFLNLTHVLWLRYFNFIIMTAGVFYSIKIYKSKVQPEKLNYLEGLAVGFLTAFVSVFSFSFFIYFYLRSLNPGFMDYLHANEFMGQYLNAGAASFIIFIEGISSGAIASFVSMQYFKGSLLKNEASQQNVQDAII